MSGKRSGARNKRAILAPHTAAKAGALATAPLLTFQKSVPERFSLNENGSHASDCINRRQHESMPGAKIHADQWSQRS